MKKAFLFLLLLQSVRYAGRAQAQVQTVQKLKITILSTMLADRTGKGEWGFSALVEADGRKILFDSGNDSSVVMANAKALGIDLSGITTLILSHSHDDHTGGWTNLRKVYKDQNRYAYDTTWVGDGFFNTRYKPDESFSYSRSQDSLAYTNDGGHFKICGAFTEIYPGIYLTGPVPRKHDEKNYSVDLRVRAKQGFVKDDIHEDMSLIIATTKGLVLLSGCGHSGIVNTVDYMNQSIKGNLYAAIGGFHLLNATDDQMKWTAEHLKQAGMQYFVGAHCTGINAVYEIRQLCGMNRNECTVGSVGSSFDLSTGIEPGMLAK
jgi:7,8-dihydropterin-6-yl-methyl-4-(beta-D-ribofuranosyl)aminobenzene 5'-phosphate synthase